MLRFFRTNLPQGLYVYMPVMMVLMHLPFYFNLPEIQFDNPNMLLEGVTEYLTDHPLIAYFIHTGLAILIGIILTAVFNDNDFTLNNTILPSLFAVVLLSSIGSLSIYIMVAIFFLSLAFWWQFYIEGHQSKLRHFFDTGFFYGLAFFFCLSFVPLLIIPVLFFAFTRTFNWREWFSLFVGILTPFYFGALISFLVSDQWMFFETSLAPVGMGINSLSTLQHAVTLSLLSFTGLMVILAIGIMSRSSNKIRRITAQLFIAIVALAVSFYMTEAPFSLFPTFIALPGILLASKVMVDRQKYIDFFFHLVLIAAVVSNYSLFF